VGPRLLQLVAIGNAPLSLLRELDGPLTTQLGLTLGYGKPALTSPAYAFNKDRNQYHSTAILRRLSQTRRSADAAPVLGITDVDLFLPDAPFVFGEADRSARTAVVSLARLALAPDGRSADAPRVMRRLQVEAVHELGHLLGLSHCQDLHCAMLLSHKATDSDRKGPGLCAGCRAALGLA
jgi:archaemetzincin